MIASKAIMMLVLLVIFALADIICSLSVLRGFASGITKLTMVLRAASEGDLTKVVEDPSNDELGQIGIILNNTLADMRSMIESILQHAATLANSSEELTASAAQVAQATEAQRDQANQIATAMQEMSATVAEVSENSSVTSNHAQKAEKMALEGGEIVSQTIRTIREVADSVHEMGQRIEQLGKSSGEIGRIIGVIDDIADQTNLLALNAAIEAARAGEQGRGFAVVADEVRKLAERTTTATKEIASMIQSIQDEASSAVDVMSDSGSKVEASVETAHKAELSLKQIIESVSSMQQMVTQIATAATEQAAATEEVNGNMTEIAKMVQHSSVATVEAAKACQDLSALAMDLQQATGKFKVSEQGNSIGAGRYSDNRPPNAPPSREGKEAQPLHYQTVQ
jgi:methyl-accepting chemotaxis protein